MELSTVISHLQNPRQMRISNYAVLREEIHNIFKDNIVDPAEMRVMRQMDVEVRVEYQVAQALVAELESQTPPSPQLPAAKQLVAHLRKCRTFIEDARRTGADFNSMSEAEKKHEEDRKEKGESLELDLTQAGIDLWKSLRSVDARNDVSRETALKEVSKMNPERVEDFKQRLFAAIGALQKENLTAMQINKFLRLGRTL